jgi:chromosome segregation ATPase
MGDLRKQFLENEEILSREDLVLFTSFAIETAQNASSSESRLTEMTENVEMLNRELSSLKRKSEDLQFIKTQQDDQIINLQEENAKLRQSISNGNRRNRMSDKRSIDAENDVTRLCDENQALKTNVATLSKRNTELSNKIRQIKKEKKVLQKQSMTREGAVRSISGLEGKSGVSSPVR